MLKKRIIFTLLFNEGEFVLSRNFTLQKVGNSEWLEKNYNFKQISRYIDELIILNVSSIKNIKKFCKIAQRVIHHCFVPISFGGGVKTVKDAEILFKAGADKIVINSLIDTNPKIINKMAKIFGSQSIILSIDFKKEMDGYSIWTKDGKIKNKKNISSYLNFISELNFGELYLNSMDRDGTGFGYELEILKYIPDNFTRPVIMSGGAGNSHHFLDALKKKQVDAVATANLFNFIGDGLKIARENLINSFLKFPLWDDIVLKKLDGHFSSKKRKL